MGQVKPILEGELLTVEALRGLAATFIVFFHALIYLNIYLPRYGEQPLQFNKDIWHEIFAATPVDIFFVVSGFILFRVVSIGNINPLRFLYLRVSRIAGLYWLLSILFLLVFHQCSH